MKLRFPTLAGALLVASALPLAAQEQRAPQPLLLDQVPGREPIERIEKLRLERLQESLGLTGEQTETLRRQLDESRAAMGESMERQHAAMEALHESLRREPADQEGLRRALADVEAVRAEMERRRERQTAELGRTLTPEQRARFLLFNRQFDSRLRELVERRHGDSGEPRGPRDGAPAPRGSGLRPDGPGPTRGQRIEALERRIQEMQRELAELRSGGGS